MRTPRTFKEVWAEKEANGYSYGLDALENVKLGFDLAVQEYEDTTAAGTPTLIESKLHGITAAITLQLAGKATLDLAVLLDTVNEIRAEVATLAKDLELAEGAIRGCNEIIAEKEGEVAAMTAERDQEIGAHVFTAAQRDNLRAELIDEKSALGSSRLHTKYWMIRAETAKQKEKLKMSQIRVAISIVLPPTESANYSKNEEVFTQLITLHENLVEDSILDIIEGIQKVAKNIKQQRIKGDFKNA